MGKNGGLFFRYGPWEGVLMYIHVLVSRTLWEGRKECKWVNIHWEMMCTKLRGNRTRTGA